MLDVRTHLAKHIRRAGLDKDAATWVVVTVVRGAGYTRMVPTHRGAVVINVEAPQAVATPARGNQVTVG